MNVIQIRQGFLDAGIPQQLVDELIDSYVEGKRRYHLGDHRPQEVEGGRFSEAVFRILQHLGGRVVTPIGKPLPSVDVLMATFENAIGQPDAIRLHIPRTLRLIYDVRNKRDAAHLGNGIDPNRQDATLVIANMDWVMAELVRLHHGIDPNQAQQIIDDLVTKEVPAIQEINGQPVILTSLQPRDEALLMLYRIGAKGVSLDDLAQMLRVARKDHLKERLLKLDADKLVLFHSGTGLFHLTSKGIRYVEENRLASPL
jgi:hypothetical protein